MVLHDLIAKARAERPTQPAIVERDGAVLDYATLGRLADSLRDRLIGMGVQRGDRVGLYLRKSADAVAALFGILEAGAAYVPVDPGAPAARNAYIHHDCGVRVVIIERRFAAAHREELTKLGGNAPPFIELDGVGGGAGLDAALARTAGPARHGANVRPAPDDLAYVLYTSGSTGKPKGVMLSHRNALAFIDWCSRVFRPGPDDVFSSHAPFHFDLSILDLYVPLKHGARLVIIPEDEGRQPVPLAGLISRHRITVWYSAPSILSLLAQLGRIAEHDFSHLRLVLFAGEVMPVARLRAFQRQVPAARYFNLYGPTETNVCTYHEIPAVIPDDRVDPYPIGRTCEQLQSKVIDSDGRVLPAGGEGELCIAGPNVTRGYWNLPEQTAACFLPRDASGERWYKTGDIVVEEAGGIYRYVGRRDRMVKKRGYRIELGEIEACLYRHAAVREAAVIAIPDGAAGLQVKAHLSLAPEQRPSLIELKAFCSRNLPLYMVPDSFSFHDRLPKTSTDKIDYQALKTRL
jgi:amino acid adenylation domain-containing protein